MTFNFNKIITLSNGIILKDIPNTKGNYKISNKGDIISIKSGITLKGRINSDGYKYAIVRINNKNITVKHHRLVAEMFVDNPNNYPVVNHKDENKLNNKYSNLEWCTIKYNNIHGSRLNKCSITSGIPINVYKQVNGILILQSTENSILSVTKIYNIGLKRLYNILNNKTSYYKVDRTFYVFKYADK